MTFVPITICRFFPSQPAGALLATSSRYLGSLKNSPAAAVPQKATPAATTVTRSVLGSRTRGDHGVVVGLLEVRNHGVHLPSLGVGMLAILDGVEMRLRIGETET